MRLPLALLQQLPPTDPSPDAGQCRCFCRTPLSRRHSQEEATDTGTHAQPTLNPDSSHMIKDIVLLNRYAALAAAHGDRSGFKPGDVVAVKCVLSLFPSVSPSAEPTSHFRARAGRPSTPPRSSSSASSPSRTASSAPSPPTRNRPSASRRGAAGSRATRGTTRATRTRSDRSRSGSSTVGSTGCCGRRGEREGQLTLPLFLPRSRVGRLTGLAPGTPRSRFGPVKARPGWEKRVVDPKQNFFA